MRKKVNFGDRAVIAKRSAGKPPRFYNNTIEDKYLIEKHRYIPLLVSPTMDNFKGMDLENPIICSYFGCKVKLSRTERLFGNTCIHHQNKKKVEPSNFISYPTVIGGVFMFTVFRKEI